MDLTHLEQLALGIAKSSPNIRNYALEQVLVTKAQEERLAILEKRLSDLPLLDPKNYTMDQLAEILAKLKG